jgi:hypothetical protein
MGAGSSTAAPDGNGPPHLDRQQLANVQARFASVVSRNSSNTICSGTSATGGSSSIGGTANGRLAATLRRATSGARGSSKPAPTASIAELSALPELSGNPLLPRILSALDGDGDGRLSAAEWARAVELFAAPSGLEELYHLAFRVVDADRVR